MRRTFSTPLFLAAAVFTAASGWIHIREWFETYRDVPSGVPGAEVVTVGFPVQAALSVVGAVALVAAAVRFRDRIRLVAAGVAALETASLGALVITRTGSLFGWTEPVWSQAAEQARAVAIGALVSLALAAVLDELHRRRTIGDAAGRRSPRLDSVPAT